MAVTNGALAGAGPMPRALREGTPKPLRHGEPTPYIGYVECAKTITRRGRTYRCMRPARLRYWNSSGNSGGNFCLAHVPRHVGTRRRLLTAAEHYYGTAVNDLAAILHFIEVESRELALDLCEEDYEYAVRRGLDVETAALLRRAALELPAGIWRRA